jgi:exosortase/archaeosortase family protein
MKKFILLYWLNIILLFSLFYWDISPIAEILNQLQTDLTTYIVSLTLNDEITKGYEIIINSHYSLVIEKACNGMVPYLFFLASIIAFPSTLSHKIKWSLVGYTIITTINIFRIWLVAKLVLAEVDNFSLAHDFIGNAILIFIALTMFILFVKTKKLEKD